MQQETEYQDQQPQTSLPPAQQQQYTTHISELISQPAANNVYVVAAEYILSSLYQLSSYLFTKKVQENGLDHPSEMNQNELSFNSYLQLIQQDLGKFQKTRTLKKSDISMEKLSMESELVKCYSKVERIYFEENYVLDMSYFQSFYAQLKNKNIKGKNAIVNNQIQKLCEYLDLVQINLFSQIHCKFQEYFKVVANFQYLKQSISLHLLKLRTSRSAVRMVKSDFTDKSVKLRKKIQQRQNIQKLLKVIKQVQSFKKLPQAIQGILASSLPQQALQLFEKTKGSISQLKTLNCLKNISETVKQSQNMLQKDITNSYATQLYNYLQQCHNKDSNNLQQLWRKIEVYTCLDKDSSFVLDQLNSSTNSALSDNPQLLQQLELMDFGSETMLKSSALVPRQEDRQYKISMILLQSYKYLSFSPEVIKIKVCNALRVFTKRFEKELLVYLNKVVINEIQTIKEKTKQTEASQDVIKQEGTPALQQKKLSEENESPSVDVVEKVSAEFYIKHLGILNEIFKDTITRFMGYLLTLVTEYEAEYNDQWNACPQNDRSKIQEHHKKFRDIFKEECSLLPSIFKIVEQKIKYLLTLKNISNIDGLQFYRWITTLRYWQKFLNHLIQFDPLLSHEAQGPAQQAIEELISIVRDNIRKSIQVMGLQSLLYELTVDYINVYHNNTSNNEVINTLQQDTWQSTEIPAQFGDILQAIFNPDGNALNASVTILDSSTNSSKGIINMSRDKDDKGLQQSSAARVKTKIKLLKNNILIGGVRYKVNLSFLILCESLGQYMKLARILSNVLEKGPNQKQNKVMSYVYQKAYNLIEVYCQKSKELIIDTKALSFGKIKAKTINAKHICLLSNCLSVVQKITEEMFQAQKVLALSLVQQRKNTITLLETTRESLINKLTTILQNKTEKQINDFLQQDKLNPQQPQASSKTSNAIISTFLQMVEITDEYLQIQGVRQVLKSSFQALSQKYLTHLLLKGGKQRAEVELLIQRLKFLRKYFPTQYQTLLKQIPA